MKQSDYTTDTQMQGHSIRSDLHLHTQHSDGIDTAETVVKKCLAQGLNMISITDHDCSPDVSHLQHLSRKYGLPIVIGMECGSKDPESGKSAHILAYGMKDFTELDELMRPVLERRNQQNLEAIATLCQMGYPLTEAEVRAHMTGKYIYRQHLIYALYKKGAIPEMWGEWTRKMIRDKVLVSRNTYPAPEAIVDVIVRGGGLAVLAHPGQQQNFFLLPRLKEHGLAGVELVHPSNSPDDMARIRTCARKLDLFMTGGSDYHGILSNSGGAIGAYVMTYEAADFPLWDALCE